jgi:hypothetical protein
MWRFSRRSSSAKSDLEEKLETQYNESMGAAMMQRGGRHRGLGYHGASDAQIAPPPPDQPGLPMPVPDHDSPEPETEANELAVNAGQ